MHSLWDISGVPQTLIYSWKTHWNTPGAMSSILCNPFVTDALDRMEFSQCHFGHCLFSWYHLGQSVTILVTFLGDTGICHCFIHRGIAWALLCQLSSCTQLFFPRDRPGPLPWLSSAINGFSWWASTNAFLPRSFCRVIHKFTLTSLL